MEMTLPWKPLVDQQQVMAVRLRGFSASVPGAARCDVLIQLQLAGMAVAAGLPGGAKITGDIKVGFFGLRLGGCGGYQ